MKEELTFKIVELNVICKTILLRNFQSGWRAIRIARRVTYESLKSDNYSRGKTLKLKSNKIALLIYT